MIKDGQNIFDYTIEQTGAINNFMDIINLNQISVNDNVQSGEQIAISTSLEKTEKYEKTYNEEIQKFTIYDNQNIFDVSLQYFGGIEYSLEILTNNNLSVNSNLQSGEKLIINNKNRGSEKIKNLYIKDNIIPSNYQNQNKSGIVSGDYNNDYNNDYYN